VRDLGESVECNKCLHFTVHPSYPYIVICVDLGQVVAQPREACRNYVSKTWDRLIKQLSESGFLYCVECSRPIFDEEELRKHKTEFIPFEFFTDEVAYEEAPSGD
jgi:hypothetical protein